MTLSSTFSESLNGQRDGKVPSSGNMCQVESGTLPLIMTTINKFTFLFYADDWRQNKLKQPLLSRRTLGMERLYNLRSENIGSHTHRILVDSLLPFGGSV